MKLLVTIPGIGNKHFEEKKTFLKSNIGIIKDTFIGDVDFLLFNYSDNDFSDFENIKIVKEGGIIGQYIFKYLNPDDINRYDYIILMLDDILLSDNFNIDYLIKLYKESNLNIISPSLTKDSKFSYEFMIENYEYKDSLRIVNFCEYFFYLMDFKSYEKYYKLFDDKTYWLWGIDLCLYKQGFKMGIFNDFKIKHFYLSESYNKDLPNPYIEMWDKEKKFGKIGEKINLDILFY
jgi:hypothetical protein